MAVQRDADSRVPVALRVDDAAYWLEEWWRLRALSPEQNEQALERRQQEFARRPDIRSRLRLALLLAEGPAEVRDERRALKLLQGLEPHASASSRALARLLTQAISEKAGASDKIVVLKQALTESEVRVKELERQLQELTNIEQSIQKRETPLERKEK